jgi:hypothetical protein
MKVKIDCYPTTSTKDAYIRCNGVIYFAITDVYILLYSKRDKDYPRVYLLDDYTEIKQRRNKKVIIKRE